MSSKMLGQRIEWLRKNVLRISQNELADLVGAKSKAVISNWERGANLPPIDAVVKLARESKVNLDWLMEGIGTAFGKRDFLSPEDVIENLSPTDKNLIKEAFESENPIAVKLAINLILEKEKYLLNLKNSYLIASEPKSEYESKNEMKK